MLGGGFGVREGEDFGGEVAVVGDFAEGGEDGGGVGVAVADGLSVRIGEVDVAEAGGDGLEGGGEVRFLDVHVEEVGEDDGVGDGAGVEECQGVCLAVDEVGFVAVEWFVDEGDVVGGCGVCGV